MSTDKPTATLNVRGVGTMNKKKRAKVASWLRRQAKFIEDGGDKEAKITTGLYRAGMRLFPTLMLCLVVLLVSGCVTKYEEKTSDWEVAQVGQICYMRGHGDVKLNLPTEVDGGKCLCSQLIETRRIVVKAGQSPTAWACPAPSHMLDLDTRDLEPVVAHAMADTYIEALGRVLGGLAIGLPIGLNMPGETTVMQSQSVAQAGPYRQGYRH